VILIELTAAIDAAGTLQTFYVAAGRYVTAPGDTPAHTAFLDRLLDPGSLGRHAYADGRTGGATRLETGEIVIANADGALDGWINYSFDGRAVVIRSGEAGAYPASFTTLLTGTAEGIEATFDKIVVRLRDKSWVFDKPVCGSTYAGNNSLPNGLEGAQQDVKGRRKPKTYGKVYNVSPPCVNTSRLIYEVGVCNAVDAGYDRGATLTKGADYTSQSDMETNVPAAGNFRAWPAGGYVRLGSQPAGQVTFDVTQGATAGNRTVAQILKQLALDAGIASGAINSADVTALDTANSAVVGIWVDDETSFLAAMDQVAASVGAWYGFDAGGTLRMGQLTAPSGTPALTLYDYDIGEAIERVPPKDIGIPAWRMTLGYARNFTVQASDLAGSVSAVRAAWLAEDFRREKAEDAAVKTQWLLAPEPESMGLLTAQADASTEVTRQLNLYKVRRDVYDVPLSIERAAGLDLMAVVRLVYARFNMGAGRDFRLIGLRFELAEARAVLSLWG